MADAPSPYVPITRWFGSERDRELQETFDLYRAVKASQDAFTETPLTVGKRVYRFLEDIPDPAQRPFLEALHDLMEDETHIWELPPPDLGRMSLKEFVEYRNLLYAKQYFFANQAEVLEEFHQALVRLLCGTAGHLPQTEQPSPFTIPLIFGLEEPRLAVEQIFGTLTNGGYEDRGLFKKLTATLYRNLCRASGREDERSKKPWKYPRESPLPLDELVEAYLADTPFQELFLAPVPLKLTRDDRMSHMHVVGGTGAGKTTLLERLIRYDLESDDPPSLVIIDPHSDLIDKLTKADLGIAERLVVINPRDIEHPPALNVFAQNRDRLGAYDDVTREQVTAGVIQTFDYLFSGIFGADLTAKQAVFFRYVARLMLSLPETMGRNATILDMLALMNDAEPYRAAIERLPDIPREFFLRDFGSRTFAQTKEQIRYRLQAILENPTMARLFTAPDTKLDLFEELNRGSIILVDAAKDFLKGSSPHFGRIFISLVLQAILERSAVPSDQRKDTFLIVDEAASFFDSNIDDLLTEARKYRCGLVLAHQYLDQASHGLRASLAANTGIKFASGLSSADARAMAPDMRTTADFILGQPRLQFAAHIRNTTPHAVSIPVQPGAFAELPRLSAEDRGALIERSRRRVSLPARARPPKPDLSRLPDEDISREW